MKLKKRWLEFVDIPNPKRKTKKFKILNKETKDFLGEIKWKGSWRQYVFDDGEIELAEGCLYELFEKIKELRFERKNDNPN